MARFPLLPSPLAGSPLLPFVSPSTYLAPSSCDRNRPPPSQVACKLTSFAPPFPQLTHPLQISRTPGCPAPNNDDLGNIPALAIRNNKFHIRLDFKSDSRSNQHTFSKPDKIFSKIGIKHSKSDVGCVPHSRSG
jgi:hypothetical protein